MFWFYESTFDKDFAEKEKLSEWFDFFSNYSMGEEFMGILSESDYAKPTEKRKKQILTLWPKYLFSEKNRWVNTVAIIGIRMPILPLLSDNFQVNIIFSVVVFGF